MKLVIKIYCIWFVLSGVFACRDFVDVPPPVTQLVGSAVFSTNPSAAAAVTGIYQSMVTLNHPVGGGENGISALLGLSADEFDLYPTQTEVLNQTYSNALLSTTNITMWNSLYNCIYRANAAIEGLANSTGLTPSVQQQLTGEAKFVRAFCYFYLVNIYGDVPLVLATDHNANKLIARSSSQLIYDRIITDLNEAQSLLSDNYLAPDGTVANERVRPNKFAASALLARVYLYQGKWENAAAQSSLVIENSVYRLETDLNSVFLKSNAEAIWQLEPPNFGFNAPDANFLVGYLYFGGPSPYAPFLLSNSLVSSFEPGDLRKANWIVQLTTGADTYSFPYKYKLYYTGTPPAEYPVLLRLAEQYLIRAEARAAQNDLNGAAADLNAVRARAGLSGTLAGSKTDLLNAIYRERKFELFTEYGHRLLDLKRTNTIDAVMTVTAPLKGGTWQATDKLYPIPLSEIQANPKMTQNPGYQ